MSKLLIVDDEIDIREFAQNFFRKRNINVLTAAGGREAIHLIEQEKPDLVLLDVRMEEMTGLEVLKNLRQNKNDVKVIMVTGVDNGEAVKEAHDLGITGYIHKPLVLDELEKVVLAELNR
jgi:two-component system response regulator (stage 0 sporulation protein F)